MLWYFFESSKCQTLFILCMLNFTSLCINPSFSIVALCYSLWTSHFFFKCVHNKWMKPFRKNYKKYVNSFKVGLHAKFEKNYLNMFFKKSSSSIKIWKITLIVKHKRECIRKIRIKYQFKKFSRVAHTLKKQDWK